MKKLGVAFGAFALVLAIAPIAAGCGDDDDDKEADATAQLCADLDELNAAGAELDALNSDSTLDEIRDARKAYGDALDDALDSAGDLAEVRSGPIDDAYKALDEAINDIPDDTTAADALASIQDELDAVDAAYDEAFSGVDCA